MIGCPLQILCDLEVLTPCYSIGRKSAEICRCTLLLLCTLLPRTIHESACGVIGKSLCVDSKYRGFERSWVRIPRRQHFFFFLIVIFSFYFLFVFPANIFPFFYSIDLYSKLLLIITNADEFDKGLIYKFVIMYVFYICMYVVYVCLLYM